MAANSMLDFVRRVACQPVHGNRDDQELIEAFLTRRDHAAFETILARHGPMVLDVCRSQLTDDADIEDAFQVTFLVLARKARSIRKTASLASWLHGVAYRTACKAKAQFSRRKKHEARATEPTTAVDADDLTWREVREVIHEELERLPERNRSVLLLCYLQGKTQDQAAAELGVPLGTLKGRLERGRELLRSRLVRRGLAPAVLVALAAWPTVALGGVTAALADRVTQVILAELTGRATAGLLSARLAELLEAVLAGMSCSKLKIGIISLVVMAALGVASLQLGSVLSANSDGDPEPAPLVKLPAAPQGKPVEPKEEDAWVTSADGKLALRLRVKETTIAPNGFVELTGELKNVSEKTIHVIKPFGDWYRSRATGLDIRGPLGKLKYAGPTPGYVIGTLAFVHLKPGEVLENSMRLTIDEFIGFDLPGTFTIHYDYAYGGEWNEKHKLFPAPWEGKIRSKPIKIDVLKDDGDVWTMSQDKAIGLQLTGDVNPAAKTLVVVLKATIRNFSTKPLAVPKPLGGPFTGMPAGLDIRGPKGGVKYIGPEIQARPWMGNDFVTLIPGEKHETRFELAPEIFAGGDQIGKYTIQFEYSTIHAENIAKSLGIANYWLGKLPRITFVYDHPKDAKRELPLPNAVVNAGRNPKDVRILALVAYLDKNDIKLVHDAKTGYWLIKKPAAPNGDYMVSIRTFPEDASEKQMRMALQGINLAYKLNVPARIAMSYVGGLGATKATRKDLEAVEETANRLFQAYRPAPPPKDADEAFHRFAEHAAVAVAKMPKEGREYWEKQLVNRKTWTVKRQPLRDAHGRITDTLGPQEHSLILLGELQSLDRAGECWAIEHFGGFSALAGYVDVQTGLLELLWLIPEG